MTYADFVDSFSELTREERHYRHLFEQGRLPAYPDWLGRQGEVTLPESGYTQGHDVVLRKHPCFLPEYPHDHAFLECVLVLRGSCSQEVYGRHVVMQEGDALLISPHTWHSIGVFDEKSVVVNVLVGEALLSDLLSFEQGERSSLERMFDALREHTGSLGCALAHAPFEALELLPFFQDAGNDSLTRSRLALFFALLYQSEADILVGPDKQSERLALVLRTIRRHPEDASLSSLSSLVHVTPSYLSALIREETGMTLSALVAKRKMELARTLLQEGLGTKETASRLGMSPERFCRFFKRWSGATPQGWRTGR